MKKKTTYKKPRCPACNSRAFVYDGRADGKGKHQFRCTNCGNRWQYGYDASKYNKNAMKI